ncbi:MAG: hypothetical protein OZ921_04910 [Sorangiineae bacterium]|nr:hypothetical protein [Polyangiaceae bacterium]MEB2321831.1 hypothetical protein [Sorangiineae bacterium]
MGTKSVWLTTVVLGAAIIGGCGSDDSPGGGSNTGGSGGGSNTGGSAGSATGGAAGSTGGSAGAGGASGSAGAGGLAAGGASGSSGAAGGAGAGGGFSCAIMSKACQSCIKDSCSAAAAACESDGACKGALGTFGPCLCNAQMNAGGDVATCISTMETAGGQLAADAVDCVRSNCGTDCDLKVP